MAAIWCAIAPNIGFEGEVDAYAGRKGGFIDEKAVYCNLASAGDCEKTEMRQPHSRYAYARARIRNLPILRRCWRRMATAFRMFQSVLCCPPTSRCAAVESGWHGQWPVVPNALELRSSCGSSSAAAQFFMLRHSQHHDGSRTSARSGAGMPVKISSAVGRSNSRAGGRVMNRSRP